MTSNNLFFNWLALIKPQQVAQAKSAQRLNAITAASIFWHWLLGLVGWLISFRASYDLLVASGLTSKQLKLSVELVVSFALLSLILLVCGFLLLSLLITGAFALIGIRTGFRAVLATVCIATFPITLGLILGKLAFALVEPLATFPPVALSLLLKPYSMGIDLLLALSAAPLTMQWFITQYLDIFWLWSLVIFAVLAKHWMDLSRLRLGILVSVVVLLSLLLVTLQWQLAQQVLAGMM